MKRFILAVALVVEAIACIVLGVTQSSWTDATALALSFPFAQIADGLRALSLPGGIGNIVAVALYTVVGLLPLAGLLIVWHRRHPLPEDILIGLVSPVLFAVLYIMINPTSAGTLASFVVGMASGRACLGIAIYSILSAYAVLRFVRLFRSGETRQLFRYISWILAGAAVVIVYAACGVAFSQMINLWRQIDSNNTTGQTNLVPTYVFIVLQFVVTAIAYAFDTIIVFAAVRLVGSMRADLHSTETLSAASLISRLCVASLVTILLAQVALNIGQLAFIRWLENANWAVTLPIFPVVGALIALLATQLITESNRLKTDNDLFI